MSWSFSSTFPSEAPWATRSHDFQTSFHPTCRPPIGCIVVTPSSQSHRRITGGARDVVVHRAKLVPAPW